VVDQLHQTAERLLAGQIEHFVIHDLRRTVRTHLSPLKVPEVVGELILGHALRGIVGTYNVYDFEAEKRDALQVWSKELIKK
jgi:integrase